MKANEIAEQFKKLKESLPIVKIKTKDKTWIFYITQQGVLALDNGDDCGYDWQIPIGVAVKLKEFLNEYY